MKIYYGCSDFTSFTHLPAEIDVMISAATIWKYGDKETVRKSVRFEERFLDSGGFGFNVYGDGYPFSAEEYLHLVDEFAPNLFATLDYPCEPHLEFEPKSIWDRIDMTVDYGKWILRNYHGPSIPVPVIQGWELQHYDYCIHKLEKSKAIRSFMAVGSMCMRKKYDDYAPIVEFIHERLKGKVKLHFFGLKKRAISMKGGYLRNFISSIDTCAWLWGRGNEDMFPRKASEKMFRFNRYRTQMEDELSKPYQMNLFRGHDRNFRSSKNYGGNYETCTYRNIH